MSLIAVSILACFDEQGMSNHQCMLVVSLYVKSYQLDIRADFINFRRNFVSDASLFTICIKL
jgi:hypothetical protein